MSIATEIQRIQTAKEDIKSAIIEKGGTVSDGALIDTYGEAIRGISTGDGGLDVSKFGLINEVKGTSLVTCDYVNENEHNVEIKLSSDTVTDFSGVEVECAGKNIFDWDKVFVGNIKTNGVYDPTGETRSLFVNLAPNTTYTFSQDVSNITMGLFGIGFVNTEVNPTESFSVDKLVAISGGVSSGKTFTTEATTKTVIITFVRYLNQMPTNMQLEVGSYATDYEPYTEKTYIANADGTVDGVTSISPIMNIFCEGVDILAKYYQCPSAEYDRFWDNFQEYGNRTEYRNGFAGRGWNEKTFKPKYCLNISDARNMFTMCSVINMRKHLEEQGISLDFSNITDSTNLGFIVENSTIEYFVPVDVSGVTSIKNVFRGSTKLKEAILTGVTANHTFDATYYSCSGLEEVFIDGVIASNITFQHSPLLSDECIQRIIDTLADLTGQTAQTITFNTKVVTKLSEEQIATITSKNWTLA